MAPRDKLTGLLAIRYGDQLRAVTTACEQAGASNVLLAQLAEVRRDVVTELSGGYDEGARHAEIEALAETLTPPEVIRYAEQLIRRLYPVLHPLHPIWGKIADDLNEASHIPDLAGGAYARAGRALHEHCDLRGDMLTAHLEAAHKIRYMPSDLTADPGKAVRVHCGEHPGMPGQPHELGTDAGRWVRFNRAQALAWAIIDTWHGRAGRDDPEGDPVTYAREHVTSPGAHALLDEVGRGRKRQGGTEVTP